MKGLFILMILLMGTSLFAQNLQVHYDFTSDTSGFGAREYFTTTLEMFKPDEYGATFWFVDFDYNAVGNKSASGAYWEIARYIKTPISGLSATVQYNDGLATWGPFGHVWLAGVSYPINLGFVTLSSDVLYRAAYGAQSADFQLTTVWFKPFMNGKLIFTGFFDLWTQDKSGEDGKDMVIYMEPQLWYNVWSHLSVGGELEISQNFPYNKDLGIQIYPTIGFKWNF